MPGLGSTCPISSLALPVGIPDILFGYSSLTNLFSASSTTRSLLLYFFFLLITQQFGWRTSFWLVAVLVLLAGLVVQKIIPSLSNTTSISLKEELNVFKNRKLWAAFTTSTLIIGATFAAFSYLTPILTEITGFNSAVVPFLLAFYGAATVVGNLVVGRFADRYTIPILWYGLITLTVCLVIFSIFAQNAIVTILMLLVLGLVGVPMNPAMAARVMKAANDGSLVNSVHSSVITFGVVIGSSIGGLTISIGYSLVSPLWVGAILGALGLLEKERRRDLIAAPPSHKIARQS